MPGKCTTGLTTQTSKPIASAASLRVFFAVGGVLELIGLILLAIWGYQGSFLLLNHLHHPFFDAIMPHYTHLGDGVLVTGLLLFSLVAKDRAMYLTVAVGMIGVSILIALSKNLLFADWARPAAILQAGEVHWLSLGKEMSRSFPSGHSTAAAAMFTFVALSYRGQRAAWGGVWALLAVTVAYSRVYIGAHFLGDILAGLALGFVWAMLVYKWLYPRLLFRQNRFAKSWVGLFLYGLTSVFWLGGWIGLWEAYYQ